MGISRQAVLAEGHDVRVVVHRYAAAEYQRPHVDRDARVSFPLDGRYREHTPGTTALVGPGDVTFKSRALVHEDWFGAEGTTIASIELCGADDGAEAELVRLGGHLWLLRRDAAALRLALGVVEAAVAGNLAGVETTAADLLAAGACTGARVRRPAPPAWLTRLKDEVELAGLAATPVAARAREAGVHPVHASRLFRSCFGVTITAHAQLHGVRRALARMAGREPLSQVAAAAGFYDQSHMNRVFRTVLGRAPGAVRRACVAARSRIAR